jgi:hypothetical protein
MIRNRPRILHDELRNETYFPTELEREIEADAAFHELVSGYVREALEDSEEPDAYGFLAEYNTLTISWNYDAVEAEIERDL